MQFADKVGVFVENNERLLDIQKGAYGYKERQGNNRQYQRRTYAPTGAYTRRHVRTAAQDAAGVAEE